ncbi:MAG TPA: glycoside hydrolase family 15 protein [Anaerolineales bacterium]
MTDLVQRSIEIILANQAASGAYVASPNFPTYHYCWLRDGSFIAYAVDRAGEHASARRFFEWVNRAICSHAEKVERIVQALANGKTLADSDFLHTRYTLEGEEDVNTGWGNFQIDGYGTWLWALAEHVAAHPDPDWLREIAPAVRTTVRYLCSVWRLPNYDCWEENPEYIHPYSLGAVYGGLRSVDRLAAAAGLDLGQEHAAKIADQIREFVAAFGVVDGKLVKHIRPGLPPADPEALASTGVDSSLIALGTPYGLLAPDDPILHETIGWIERDLHRPDAGVYRYREDTYFGGGEWILLAAWLGWHYTRAGEMKKASELCSWIETQAGPAGNLAEQVSQHVLAPEYYPIWLERWGPVATPLLWSHAMYLILRNELTAEG